MADLQFKFDNQPYGGTTTWTVPVADMPDYPYGPGEDIEESNFRADTGALWTYRKYDKKYWDLNFVDISDASKGTLEAIALADYQLNFIDDVLGGGGTHTVRWIGGWNPSQPVEGYWNVRARFEEV